MPPKKLQPCKPGQERNPATNRCRNITRSVSRINTVVPPVYLGYPETDRVRVPTLVMSRSHSRSRTANKSKGATVNEDSFIDRPFIDGPFTFRPPSKKSTARSLSQTSLSPLTSASDNYVSSASENTDQYHEDALPLGPNPVPPPSLSRSAVTKRSKSSSYNTHASMPSMYPVIHESPQQFELPPLSSRSRSQTRSKSKSRSIAAFSQDPADYIPSRSSSHLTSVPSLGSRENGIPSYVSSDSSKGSSVYPAADFQAQIDEVIHRIESDHQVINLNTQNAREQGEEIRARVNDIQKTINAVTKPDFVLLGFNVDPSKQPKSTYAVTRREQPRDPVFAASVGQKFDIRSLAKIGVDTSKSRPFYFIVGQLMHLRVSDGDTTINLCEINEYAHFCDHDMNIVVPQGTIRPSKGRGHSYEVAGNSPVLRKQVAMLIASARRAGLTPVFVKTTQAEYRTPTPLGSVGSSRSSTMVPSSVITGKPASMGPSPSMSPSMGPSMGQSATIEGSMASANSDTSSTGGCGGKGGCGVPSFASFW